MGTSNGLLFPTPPRLFQDEVAVALGLNQAIVLQQLVYWENIPKVGVVRDGHKWVYNTYKDWKENFKWWSIRTIQDIFLDLEKQGIVVSRQFESASGKMIKFYRVDRDRFDEIMAEKEPLLTHDVNSVSCPPSDEKSVTHDVNSVSCHDANSVHSLKEQRLQEKTETTEEKDNYVIFANDEKPSSDTPPDGSSPVKVSGSGVVKQNLAGALHNVVPAVNTVFAEILPVEPTPPGAVKVKKAASPKAALPPKQPKEPRTLTHDELALLKRVDALEPGLYEQVEERIRKYPRSQPWSVAQVYLLTGIRIAKTLWPTVTSLNGVAFEEEKLLTCYKAWLAMGYNPHGLNWLLDWYKAGGPPARYGQQAQQPAPAPSKPKLDISDPLVVDFEHWIAALPGYGSKSPRSIQLAAWLATNGDYNVAAQHIGDIEELHAKYQAAH